MVFALVVPFLASLAPIPLTGELFICMPSHPQHMHTLESKRGAHKLPHKGPDSKCFRLYPACLVVARKQPQAYVNEWHGCTPQKGSL